MGSILGLDYGSRRVGVAVSDDDQRVAVPVATLAAVPEEELMTAMRQMIEERGVERIVLGLPLSLRGTDTQQTADVRRFAERMKALRVPVTLADERFSSVAADRVGTGAGVSRDERAAVFLLQAYLDRLQNKRAP